MSHAHVPVSYNEFILRRIHKNHVDPGPPPTIMFLGFRPTIEDKDGLSVYREGRINAADVAAAGRKRGEYYIARLSVAAIEALGLTVISDEPPGAVTGHALIPELSLENCQREKTRWREVQLRLAELASRNIVILPSS